MNMDFNERVVPGVSANFLFQEALARYQFALKYVRKGDKVLDVACGTGYGSSLLAQKGKVVGIDINRDAIKYAKRKYRRVSFLVADAQKLPFKDGEFDLAVSFEFIEHIKKPEKLLHEVKRVLKRKGTFILSTPNKKFPKIVESPYHEKEYTYQELKKLLEEHFKKVTLYGETKDNKAKEAFKSFLDSQKVRENIIGKDILGFRKFIPRGTKEFIWKYMGNFFGREVQEKLDFTNFPISSKKGEDSEYFVALCQL